MWNWAGNLQYGTERVFRPRSQDELREVVRAHDRLKVLGSRHCFNDIADGDNAFLSLEDLAADVVIDPASRTAIVPGGMTYGALCPLLQAEGFALHNLASLPHISVAGACATATHGSGVRNGNLATAVSAVELISADGELQVFSRAASPDFAGVPVHLGALGVVTRMTLDLEPAYRVRQDVFERLPLEELERSFTSIVSAGDSVSLFTRWRNRTLDSVWVKRRIPCEDTALPSLDLPGATPARCNLHPLADESAESCTDQLGVPGVWYERLPHFRMGFTPSRGAELQSEYFVPLEEGMEAVRAIEGFRDEIGPHLLVTELRTVAADDLWMSPCYRRPSLAIHFTWKPDWPGVREVLPLIERELSPWEPRPHWGKLFSMSPAVLRSRYERLPDFLRLVRDLDPRGTFRNRFLEHYLGC